MHSVLLIIALNSARLGLFDYYLLHIRRPQPDSSWKAETLKYYPTGIDPSGGEIDRYTKELEAKMELKNIPSIEDMLEMAQLEGVKFLACKTSADLFDLDQNDFIEGVEIMLASDFMKQATGTDLHLAL